MALLNKYLKDRNQNISFLRFLSTYFRQVSVPGLIITVLILLIVIYSINHFSDIVAFLFPGEKATDKSANLETLKFIAYIIGGLLLVWQIWLTNRRTKAAEKTVEAMHKGQIQERFKNAIDQLGEDNEAVNLGAIYTLHHIAKDSDDLKKSVFNILCSYVRETTSHEEYQKRNTPSNKIQSLLNLLFVDRGECEIYSGLKADLHNVNLKEVNLVKANLKGVVLKGANLASASLFGANLEGADLIKVHLEKANLLGANLERAYLPGAHLERANLFGANFRQSVLGGVNLEGTDLRRSNLEEAILREAKLDGANLEGTVVHCLEWIQELKDWSCTGEEDIEKKYYVDQEIKGGKTIYRIKEKGIPENQFSS